MGKSLSGSFVPLHLLDIWQGSSSEKLNYYLLLYGDIEMGIPGQVI